jgi:hypothetical protein
MKNIIDLYEASLLDIEGTLASGENAVRKLMCLGSKFELGDGYGQNGRCVIHETKTFLSAFDWNKIKRHLKSIDYLNSYPFRDAGISKSYKPKYDMLASLILSLEFNAFDPDDSNWDRDIVFESFLKEELDEYTKTDVYPVVRMVNHSNFQVLVIYFREEPVIFNTPYEFDDCMAIMTLTNRNK